MISGISPISDFLASVFHKTDLGSGKLAFHHAVLLLKTLQHTHHILKRKRGDRFTFHSKAGIFLLEDGQAKT